MGIDNSRVEQALLNFRSGSSCAQSVLVNYLPDLGIPEAMAHKLGAGLGGGVGRKQTICGALNAGAIVFSAALGNETSTDLDQKELASAQVRNLVEDFEEHFGSSQCRDLVGVDFTTEAGQEEAEQKDVYRKVCDACVRHVCEQIESTLYNTKPE